MIGQEVVGVLGLEPIRSEGFRGKIPEILRDDHVAAAGDSGRQDVTVGRIGQRERWNKGFISGHETIADGAIHKIARALEHGAVKARLIAQQRPHPFVMNGGAPFRMIDVGDGKLRG